MVIEVIFMLQEDDVPSILSLRDLARRVLDIYVLREARILGKRDKRLNWKINFSYTSGISSTQFMRYVLRQI